MNALPKEGFNNSVVVALDYDEDGDNDLFVGGAVKPGRFPLHDKNLLLQNDKGVFKDVQPHWISFLIFFSKNQQLQG